MKILQIANGYFGSKLYAHLFASLETLDIDNIIYVPLSKRSAVPEASNSGVVAAKCFSQFDRLLFYSKQKKMMNTIESSVSLTSIDAVHAHTVFSGGYTAYQLHKKYGLPYIIAVRNTDVNCFFKYMVHLRKTGVEIMCCAEKVIFLSPAYRENVLTRYVPSQYRAEIGSKSLVIPNGISETFLVNKASPKVLRSNILRLIYIGEVRRNKNLEETLRAVKLLRKSGLDISLTVVGTILDNQYRSMIAREDFIEYHDHCSQNEVLGYLRRADIFVMPSHQETFGLVYAEAMSQGLPVLYTRGQGFDGYFPDGVVGYAISDTDSQDLAQKIQWVKQNYEELSFNCIQMSNIFDWNTIAAQYKEIYEKITEFYSGDCCNL